MKQYLPIILFIGVCFLSAQDKISQQGNKRLVRLSNFMDQENLIRPFLNDSSNFGQHQNLSFGFSMSSGLLSSVYSFDNTIYYKINSSLIADANFTLSNFIGSQYEDKYGYQLLKNISGDFDAGVRYYPLKNSYFNIDIRNYNSLHGDGYSLDLDFMGITIKRLLKNGYIDDSFSILN